MLPVHNLIDGRVHVISSNPLVPQIVMTLASSVLLALVHSYLLSVNRSRALLLWMIAWCLYAVRFVAALTMLALPNVAFLLWTHQLVTIASGFFLLWGARVHTYPDRGPPMLWLVPAVAVTIWITIGLALGLSQVSLLLPVFAYLAFANFAIALAYRKAAGFDKRGRLFVVLVFILWGLHKLDYPFLRHIPDAALWGYAIGAALSMAAGLGLLALYLDQERQRADANRRRFESLVYSINDVVYTIGPDLRFTEVYDGQRQAHSGFGGHIAGITPVELYGTEVGAIHESKVASCLESGASVTYEWSFAADRENVRHYQTTVSPIGNGEREEIVGIDRDVTEMKELQLTLQRSLQEKATLLQEVHHRVKNNMQIVISMLRLRMTKQSDHSARTAFRDIISRVLSMALVHEQLYKTDDLAAIPFKTYLSRLIPSVIDYTETDSMDVESIITGDDTVVEATIAIPLGLITVELLLNSLKHATPETEHLGISVDFRESGDGQTLVIQDNGPGLPEGQDMLKAPSLGMQLIYSLCEQIGASVTAENRDGALFTITLPHTTGVAHK